MISFCGSQAQISAKKTRFALKISSDIRSAAGELFIGLSQSLPEMSDGPTAIGEHWVMGSSPTLGGTFLRWFLYNGARILG